MSRKSEVKAFMKRLDAAKKANPERWHIMPDRGWVDENGFRIKPKELKE